MITRKFKIKECDDIGFITYKSKQYSHAFRLMYKMIDESSDKTFIQRFKERFNLTDVEYTSVTTAVKSKRKAFEENNVNKTQQINELKERLNDNENLSKRDKYKIFNKIAYLEYSLQNNVVFGGRNLLRKITREYNKKEYKNEERLQQYLNEYRYKRNNIPFFIIGEANQKGNRYFDFNDIQNGNVIYKPNRNKKIHIKFKINKPIINELVRLSELIENKEISVTVSLNNEYIYFTYDEEKLNGYSIDEISRRLEVKEIKQQHHPKEIEKQLIKDIYKKYYDEQRERKLEGKLENRCISVDLNPTNIGFSVLDKINETEYKIVFCGLFDLSRLTKKLGKSSSSYEQKYQNNKRRYELTIILKKLFNIANHYKCSMFVMEDLNGSFKSDNRGTNRKVKNLWNRELIINIITKRCNENGIELIKVNPCYSSFIGNIQHRYVDAVNASIEIGRRGLFRYTKGMFYPYITEEDSSTMEAKFGIDVLNGTFRNWVEAYKSLQVLFDNKRDFEERYRTALDSLSTDSYLRLSISSYMSKVNYISFIIV